MFIAFDGIDGAGKTTQIGLLAKRLENHGMEVNINNMGEEGFFNEIFQEIKKKQLTCSPEIREMLYYFEGTLFGEKIKTQRKVQSRRIEIVDRYILSFLSYGPLNGVGLTTIYKIVSSMPWPDIYFYIDMSPEQTLERIKKYRKIDFPEIGCKNVLSNDENSNFQSFLKHQTKVHENYACEIKKLEKKREKSCYIRWNIIKKEYRTNRFR